MKWRTALKEGFNGKSGNSLRRRTRSRDGSDVFRTVRGGLCFPLFSLCLKGDRVYLSPAQRGTAGQNPMAENSHWEETEYVPRAAGDGKSESNGEELAVVRRRHGEGGADGGD